MAIALVVEDGTGKANANSYLSVEEASDQFAGSEMEQTWTTMSSQQQEKLLRDATKWLEARFRFYGEALTADQALQWPRTKNFDELGRIIPAGVIPKQLKDAVFALAYAFAADPDSADDVVSGQGAVKSWSTDGLNISFDSSAIDGAGGRMEGAGALLGDRYINVEFSLRSIATLKDIDWLQVNKQTVVRR